MNIFKKGLITVIYIVFLFFNSCLPKALVYKPDTDKIMIGDSIIGYVNENELLFNGEFYFSIPICIDNKSHSKVYINKQRSTITSIYKTTTVPILLNDFSDSIINSHSGKNVYLSVNVNVNGQDALIISDYLANWKQLKRNHKFIANIQFIVGDSIVFKEIIYRPK
jgi:hypothetical protein